MSDQDGRWQQFDTMCSFIYRTWENFGESLLTNQMARKLLANQLAGLQLFHCIMTIGVEKFGNLYTIRQNFPPPNFSHVRYPVVDHHEFTGSESAACGLSVALSLVCLDRARVLSYKLDTNTTCMKQ